MSVCSIGIDLGGTKICGVAVDTEGRIVSGPMERPTWRERSPDDILETIAAVV